MWTERDGITPCFVRIFTALGAAGYFALTARAVFHGPPVSFTEWATGFTVIVAGGAGAVRLKLPAEDAAS